MSIVAYIRRYQGLEHQKRALEELYQSLDENLRSEIKEVFGGLKTSKSSNITVGGATLGNYLAVSNQQPLTFDQTIVLHKLNQVNGEIKEKFLKTFNNKSDEKILQVIDPGYLQQLCEREFNCQTLTDKLNRSIGKLDKLNLSRGKLTLGGKRVLSYFLACCVHQSNGLRSISGNSFSAEDFGLGKYSGAGYLGLRGELDYIKFAEQLQDPAIIDQGKDYVNLVYPWQSSIYVWNKNNLSQLAITDDIDGISRELRLMDKFYLKTFQAKIMRYLGDG